MCVCCRSIKPTTTICGGSICLYIHTWRVSKSVSIQKTTSLARADPIWLHQIVRCDKNRQVGGRAHVCTHIRNQTYSHIFTLVGGEHNQQKNTTRDSLAIGIWDASAMSRHKRTARIWTGFKFTQPRRRNVLECRQQVFVCFFSSYIFLDLNPFHSELNNDGRHHRSIAQMQSHVCLDERAASAIPHKHYKQGGPQIGELKTSTLCGTHPKLIIRQSGDACVQTVIE